MDETISIGRTTFFEKVKRLDKDRVAQSIWTNIWFELFKNTLVVASLAFDESLKKN